MERSSGRFESAKMSSNCCTLYQTGQIDFSEIGAVISKLRLQIMLTQRVHDFGWFAPENEGPNNNVYPRGKKSSDRTGRRSMPSSPASTAAPMQLGNANVLRKRLMPCVFNLRQW